MAYPQKKLEPAKLKILFICSSLEPGADGVGDYARRLAAALIRKGHNASVIAVNDRRLGEMYEWGGEQKDEGINVPVLRLPSLLPWRRRIQMAKAFAGAFHADYISLQYVPFGFHLKGLPFSLGKKMKPIAVRCKWHIMFHELSVNKEAALKFKLWALLQEAIIKSLVKKLQPAFVSTNTGIYRRRLQKMHFKTNLLPLFSNISYTQNSPATAYNSQIPGYIAGHRSGYIIGTLFGSFDFKSWDMRSLLNKFSYSFSNKRVVIVSLGRMSLGKAYWSQLQYDYPQVLFLSLGAQDAGFISNWLLHYTDFGILTTLPELASKSGSFMAFKEHGVPVVCKERSAALSCYGIPLDEFLTEVKEGSFEIPPRLNPVAGIDMVAEQFVKALEEGVE